MNMKVLQVTSRYLNSIIPLSESNITSPVQRDACFVKGMERACTHRRRRERQRNRLRIGCERIYRRGREHSIFLRASVGRRKLVCGYWGRNVAFLKRGDGLGN